VCLLPAHFSITFRRTADAGRWAAVGAVGAPPGAARAVVATGETGVARGRRHARAGRTTPVVPPARRWPQGIR